MAEQLIYATPAMAPVPRLRILRRADKAHLPPIKLTPRDIGIIEAVYSFRALSTPQIERLLFPGNTHDIQSTAKQPGSGRTNRCRHRLKLLYHHRYLFRDELPTPLTAGRRPLIYFLDTRGKETLCAHYGVGPKDIDWQPRQNNVGHVFLEHLLKTNDVRVAFTVAAQQQDHQIAKWLDDRSLHKQQRDYVWVSGPQGGKPRRVAIVPDGYVQLQVGTDDFHFLLEVDRRTVVGQYTRWGGKDWARKVRAYIAYFSPPAPGQLSLYAQRFGTPQLRVLTITTGPTRLVNLKRITERAGGRKRFWFTTFEQVSAETILNKAIWQKAGAKGQFSLVD